MKNNRPRIFIISQADESYKYGVGKYISEIIFEAQQRKQEYEFVVVNLGVEKIVRLQKTKRDGIIYINIPKPYSKKEQHLYSLTIKYSKASFCLLSELFKITKFDIFHFNSNMQHFLIKEIKNNTSATILYTIHVSLWKVFYNNEINKFLFEWENPNSKTKGIMNIRAEKENCKMADSVICLSEEMRDDIYKFYNIPKKCIKKVYNGISPKSEVFEKKKLKFLYENMEVSMNDFVLLYVGRINHQKGIIEVLDAFNFLKKNSISNLKLIVVGEGVLKKELEQRNKVNGNEVVFTGYVDKKEIPYYYQLSNAIIFPSFNEQSSYVMLEAMKYKVPMIVTDIKAFKGLKHEESCLKIVMESKNKINFDSIINNIKRLEHDIELRNGIANQAFSLFLNKHTSELMFNNTYQELVKKFKSYKIELNE